MSGLHVFTAEYLARSRRMSAESVLRYLEDYRRLHGGAHPSRLISMKVPEPLLSAFKEKAGLHGVPYQSQIKALMREWL
ncbi:MAG: hypothetical protein WC969_09690 [Elusimicrobiota bacterium]